MYDLYSDTFQYNLKKDFVEQYDKKRQKCFRKNT